MTLRRVSRSFRSFVGLLLAALFFTACGETAIPPLNGFVLDQYTQKPIQGALVSVGDTTVTTDAEGGWNVASWQSTDTVAIEATDYTTQSLALAEYTPQGTTPITLETTLRPNTLSGIVLDQYTGQPVADVLVQTSAGISATTDVSGAFKLINVPEAVDLTISGTDYTSATETLSRTISMETALRPMYLSGVVRDIYSDKPVSGIELATDTAETVTDTEGRYRLYPVEPEQALLISGGDYTSQTLTIPASTTLDLALRPSTVRGTVSDAQTGDPVTKGRVIAMAVPAKADSTKPVTGTAVAMTFLSEDGTYELNDVPEGAQIQVLAPGYRKNWTTFGEGEFTADLDVEPFEARAIYVTAATASSKATLSELFDMMDRTELNAMVIDVKLDFYNNVGGVGYISNHPLVIEAGTSEDYLDMNWIVEEAHKRDIYLIGRMAVMRDNRLADAKPEWAAQSAVTGGVWEDHGGLKWLDPFNPNVTAYNVGIAKEVADYGFDEIQFDYIRFPSDGSTSELVFSESIDPENNPQKMYQAIGAVLDEAHDVIGGSGAFFSIDVFGYATWRNMWEIGQSLEIMADHTDYVCAMVYPSHYDYNELGLGNPDEHPYEIVKDSIERGATRMEGKYALQRPWLQAFTATWLSPTITYGREEVRAQMRAVEEVPGTTGWILWNAANVYDEAWFNPPSEE